MSEWKKLDEIWQGEPIDVDFLTDPGADLRFAHLHVRTPGDRIIGWDHEGKPIHFRLIESNVRFRPHAPEPENKPIPHYECILKETKYHPGGGFDFYESGGWFPDLEAAEEFWGAEKVMMLRTDAPSVLLTPIKKEEEE